MPGTALDCRDLTVSYGARPVLDGFTLTVKPQEAVAVLGPSGAGKSTLLAAVAGFVTPSAGEIWIAGRPVAGVPPERRSVGVVFQHYALWPHLTALETVAYPFRRRGLGAVEAGDRARQLLDRMAIGHLADRHPAQLSGGEQQRVGVARALAREPGLYLFDEPTAHLDTALRATLQEELAERRRASGAAAVYATHDAGEALAVADRVALIREGLLVQVGSPQDVYERPADLWAAQLTGPASVLRAPVDRLPDGTVIPGAGVGGRESPGAGVGGRESAGGAEVLVRPEWACLGGRLRGTVAQLWYRGAHTDYRLSTSGGDVVVREPGAPEVRRGESVAWDLRRVWIPPGSTEHR